MRWGSDGEGQFFWKFTLHSRCLKLRLRCGDAGVGYMVGRGSWEGRDSPQSEECGEYQGSELQGCGGGSEDSAALFLSVGAGWHPACAVQPGP